MGGQRDLDEVPEATRFLCLHGWLSRLTPFSSVHVDWVGRTVENLAALYTWPD